MALHRSKLGPVGGVSGGGGSDGGVAVDLDPLSAFALMGNGPEDSNALRETEPLSRAGSGSSSSGTTRVARSNHQHSAPMPTAAQPPRGSRGWHAVEINPPASSSRVRFLFVGVDVAEVRPRVGLSVCLDVHDTCTTFEFDRIPTDYNTACPCHPSWKCGLSTYGRLFQ